VGLGLLKLMSPATSILGIRLQISTTQFPCVFVHPINPSWFQSATSSVTSRVCPQHLFRLFVFIHTCYMACPPQSTTLYYSNCVWFIVKLFHPSTVPLPPLSSLAYPNKYSEKDFPFEDTQHCFIIFCHSPGYYSVCKCWHHKCCTYKNFCVTGR
jgi:hypothetical protein